MKIAIGGMQKKEIEFAIKAYDPDIETIITNDVSAASMLKNGEVDYYFGACESGGGSAISILIALVGYDKCCTVTKAGGNPKKENVDQFVNEGKICFGMTVEKIEISVNMILDSLTNK